MNNVLSWVKRNRAWTIIGALVIIGLVLGLVLGLRKKKDTETTKKDGEGTTTPTEGTTPEPVKPETVDFVPVFDKFVSQWNVNMPEKLDEIAEPNITIKFPKMISRRTKIALISAVVAIPVLVLFALAVNYAWKKQHERKGNRARAGHAEEAELAKLK